MSASNDLYPAPCGPYRLCTKNSMPWREFDHVRIRISVGKDNAEGDKLFALCEWAAARFARITFVVGDTLQRHNLCLDRGVSMEKAWVLARQEGAAWISRNAPSLALAPRAALITWDEGLADPRFSGALAHFERLYEVDADFRAVLDATVRAFCDRNAEHVGAMRRERFAEASRAFLLEELAVFSFQCLEPAVDAYPGSWMQEIFEYLRVQPSPCFDAFRRDWLQVDFRRNKGFAAPSAQAA